MCNDVSDRRWTVKMPTGMTALPRVWFHIFCYVCNNSYGMAKKLQFWSEFWSETHFKQNKTPLSRRKELTYLLFVVCLV